MAGYSLLDNLDALDQALAAGSEDSVRRVKLESGKLKQLRVIPPSPEWVAYFESARRKPFPFFFFWKHFKMAGKWPTHNCPRRNPGDKRECMACEMSFALRAAGDEKVSKDCMAKRRVLMNVVDRDNEDAGSFLLELGAPFSDDPSKQKGHPPTQWQKFEELFKVYRKDVVDPSANGWDFTIMKRGQGKEGTTYDFRTVDKQSPLAATQEQIDELILGQYDLPSMVAVLPEAELRAKLGLAASASVTQGDSLKGIGPSKETAEDVLDAEFSVDSDDDF